MNTLHLTICSAFAEEKRFLNSKITASQYNLLMIKIVFFAKKWWKHIISIVNELENKLCLGSWRVRTLVLRWRRRKLRWLETFRWQQWMSTVTMIQVLLFFYQQLAYLSEICKVHLVHILVKFCDNMRLVCVRSCTVKPIAPYGIWGGNAPWFIC